MIIIAAILLLSLGVVVIYTSDQTLALTQGIYGLLGILAFFIVRNFDYHLLKPLIKYFYFLVILLLVVVFIIDFETRGSVRWIPLGPFNLQPSEFGKIALILMLSNFWSDNMPIWKNIGLSFLITVPVLVLVFQQPDLGTTTTLFFIWLTLLIFSNTSLYKLLILGFLGGIVVPFTWFFLKSYQRQRLLSFLFPEQDPLGVGYNVIQSTIAVGSGQIFGRGLGRGTQSRLQFLPEFRTDFIFAFIAEELGLVGSFLVLFFYSVIFYSSFLIIRNTKDLFGQLIIVGSIGMLFFQIAINIGMNIGVLPITGITLPFLSYGGSSILTVFISLGLIASVQKFGKKKFSSFELLTEKS